MSLSSYNVTKQNLVYAMFNQYLFTEAKNNIDLVEYYYATDSSTMSNSLIRELIKAIKNYTIDSIDEPLFRSILARQGKTDAESNVIMSEIVKNKLYDNNQIDPARKYLRGICNQAIMNKGRAKYPNDPEAFVKYVKSYEYHADHSDLMTTDNFDSLDVNLMDQGLGYGWESRYEFINRSYDPLFKYESGQMIMVTAPPGTGKTLFMMGECLKFCTDGARCHYIAMGDMKSRDFIVRMGAIHTGMKFSDVNMNFVNVYNSLKMVIGNRLGLTIVPAAKITIDQYMEYIKERINEYDVLFIDYDSNFATNSGDNMYLENGYIYNRLTELSGLGKLVFIAAQPKISAWGKEVIEMNEVGESARKQHSVDCIISIGKYVGNPNHLGVMKIVKNRRGEEGEEAPYIRLNTGRFINIPKDLYKRLVQITDKRDYNEGELNSMISENERLVSAAKQAASVSAMTGVPNTFQDLIK